MRIRVAASWFAPESNATKPSSTVCFHFVPAADSCGPGSRKVCASDAAHRSWFLGLEFYPARALCSSIAAISRGLL